MKLAQSLAHRVGQGLFNDSMQLGIDFGVLTRHANEPKWCREWSNGVSRALAGPIGPRPDWNGAFLGQSDPM